MKADPQSFANELQKSLGDGLRSVVLYGSSVAGDFVDKRSDYNLLVVVDDLGIDVLQRLREPVRKWVRAGQRPPLLFTTRRLQQSADVFPIELFDLRDQHRILFGEDVVARLELTMTHLRLQLESELKSKLIALREAYLASDGGSRSLLEIMVASLSNFQVLMRAALRLHGEPIPAEKDAVVDQLARRIKFDADAFHQVARIKAHPRAAREVAAEQLFQSYLRSVECLVDAVDARTL